MVRRRASCVVLLEEIAAGLSLVAVDVAVERYRVRYLAC